ncbi:efflux transporter outer membrane subunit [Granulicella sp. S190]|uniref:efflux transporter outer membrane subunit n=1 Tax=Granulicella sp. S190 TaxID=1747226 RepID=UPI00131B9C00|nr:efflux transporter outer membrane subunit [Granulicella sp. S190]
MKRQVVFVFVCWFNLLFSGCMVGPKYVKPTIATAPAFKEQPPESFKEVDGWKPAQPGDQTLRGKWWEIFNDQQLNSLEEELTVDNQDLKVSEARFRQARSMIRFNRSAEFPTISTSPSVVNERTSANAPYFPQQFANNGTGNYTLPFDLSYEVDLWGKIRHAVNASREEAQASAADLQTANLSLHAELAIDYFELRSADAQKQLLDDTVKAYTDALKLTQDRFSNGAAPKADVAQAQTQLDGARVADTDVTVARAQYEHAIATLIGKPPATFNISFAPQTPLKLAVIPVGLPTSLLERRPDIAATERRVAEANEQIGIARAAYFPSLTLDAAAGFEGNTIANLFNWSSRLWAVGPQMSQTIFDGGRRRAVSESATANYDGTVAAYRQATLTAFQEVEDNLAALRILEREAQQQEEGTASASESLQLFTNRYQGGVDNYLQVITAQTVLLSNQRNDIDLQRRRMDATVLLVKAIGGGWDTTQLPKL